MATALRLLAATLIATLAGCGAGPAAVPVDAGLVPMPIQARVPAQRRMLMAAGDVTSDWNLRQIAQSGYRVMATATGARGVVAVLDTGIDPNQPELAGHVYPIQDLVGQDIYNHNGVGLDFTGKDGNGHGTHVAGIIAAVSQGFNVRVLPIKVIPDSGVGDDKLLAAGIERAIAWRDPADPSVRVRVMNLSVSSPRTSDRLTVAIRHATEAGILVVGAAGNEGEAVDFPSTMPEVLTVSATTISDDIADYSCFGPSVDLAAPGGSDDMPIYSTWPTYLTSDDLESGIDSPHAHAGLIGTSMATPHVAAMAAVLGCVHPEMNARQVRSALISMADDLGSAGPDAHFGYGRLNYARVLGATRDDAR